VDRLSDIADRTEVPTMDRIYVAEIDIYSEIDIHSDATAHATGREWSHCQAGYFSRRAATYWHGNQAIFDGANLADVNTYDQNRGQGLYRTAQGRWVLRQWSNWEGTTDVYTYVTDGRACAWLVFNDYDADAEKYFGAVESERGPGRPEIGNPVQVRLGDLLERVDAYAAEQGRTRADALRELIGRGLSRHVEPHRSEATGDGHNALVRIWARAQGFQVPDQGGLPASLVEAFRLYSDRRRDGGEH